MTVEPQTVIETGQREDGLDIFYAPDDIQSYTGDPIPVDPLAWRSAYPDAAAEIPKNLTMADLLLVRVVRELTAWQEFRDFSTVNLSASGAGSASFRPALEGYKARITRIGISVTGASSAATVAVYVAQGGTDEGWLVDFAGALTGSSPSRTVFSDNAPIYVDHDENLTIAIAGAVASSVASVGIYGERRSV